MSHYTITVASNPGTVFAHTGGTLEVVISDESVFRASAEIKFNMKQLHPVVFIKHSLQPH